MAVSKSGTQRKGQQENQSDGGQTPIGYRLALALIGGGLGTVPAGVQKAVFESPVLGQIIPAIVLQLPAVMTQAANLGRGESQGIERRDPQPFVRSLFLLELTSAVMLLRDHFFGADHAHQARILPRERQTRGVPELGLVAVAAALLGAGCVGRPARK